MFSPDYIVTAGELLDDVLSRCTEDQVKAVADALQQATGVKAYLWARLEERRRANPEYDHFKKLMEENKKLKHQLDKAYWGE